jgi:hypothetical protein
MTRFKVGSLKGEGGDCFVNVYKYIQVQFFVSLLHCLANPKHRFYIIVQRMRIVSLGPTYLY